ncbi:MAG: C40 family peptidase [Bacteroidales bacterium]|jgi:cell wall-associated NlpC family hydrolase|nr:C40 family peptidase [Bacteroidales bacterium]
MKKSIFIVIILITLFSCSKHTYISEEIYYTVEDNAKVAKREQSNTKAKNKVKTDNYSSQNNSNTNNSQTQNSSTSGEMSEQTIKAVIEDAKTFIGVPYKYGGVTPEGFDCSGFLVYVFQKHNVNAKGNAVDLANQCKKIEKNQIKRGDLVFFKGSDIKNNSIGHVALIIEVSGSDFKMIHATTSKGVIINDYSQYEYWTSRYLFAGRLK